jgi:hypothetical protein
MTNNFIIDRSMLTCKYSKFLIYIIIIKDPVTYIQSRTVTKTVSLVNSMAWPPEKYPGCTDTNEPQCYVICTFCILLLKKFLVEQEVQSQLLLLYLTISFHKTPIQNTQNQNSLNTAAVLMVQYLRNSTSNYVRAATLICAKCADHEMVRSELC